MQRTRAVIWWAGAPLRAALLGLIAVYRLTLAGLLGGQCRFHPSCSAYAEQAIRNCGAIGGSALAVWRVLRCSPLTKGGVDYPPSPPAWRTGGRPASYETVIHDSGERAGTPS
jgi:putative membrane protein insertion efficiency factor